jgi:hypothetical protein
MAADDEFRKLAAELAKDQARKAITKSVFGDDEEEQEDDDDPGLIKKGIAVVVGVLAGAWMFDQIIDIIPFVDLIPWAFAGVALSWSLNQWGLRPIRRLRKWRAARQLRKAEKEAQKALKS